MKEFAFAGYRAGYTPLRCQPRAMTSHPGRSRVGLEEAEGGQCCLPWRRAALVVAWTEMILVFMFLVTLLSDLTSADGRLIKTGALLVSCLVHLVLSCLLLHALREYDQRKVWAWVWVRAVVLVTDLLVGVVEAVAEVEQKYAVCCLSFCLLAFGNIWVVRTFARELEAWRTR
ncbi:uncharacterized protein LOC122267251 [Penaeus japonicus]|uniref:uncharacterized protein LOC122267251 n=1 Tax=Penaeus japonicus TaxID=27405 RepID=UPI001C711A55|nr:uncharacterized protein LOC122267251 [Penaeus japonicus]